MDTQNVTQQPQKKKKGCLIAVIIAVVLVIIIIIAAVAGGSGSSSSSTTQSSTKAATSSIASSKSETAKTIAVEKDLTPGVYTVGVDFPSGTYNFTATKGGGNVMTDDGSINQIMGVKSKGDNYAETFNNANLTDGQKLSVEGLNIKIKSDKASGNALKKRENVGTDTKELSAGNYTAGKDFKAGTYDLSIVSGKGNVTTEDGSLNLILGKDSDDMYTQTYSNAELSDGAVLKVEGNAKIKIAPAK